MSQALILPVPALHSLCMHIAQCISAGVHHVYFCIRVGHPCVPHYVSYTMDFKQDYMFVVSTAGIFVNVCRQRWS
jgi:hypothetical protein